MGGIEGYFSPSVSLCLCVHVRVCAHVCMWCMPFGLLQGRGRKGEMFWRKRERIKN